MLWASAIIETKIIITREIPKIIREVLILRLRRLLMLYLKGIATESFLCYIGKYFGD